MLRCRKQLLGAIGLALVAIMTAIAYALPAPDASAVSQSKGVGLTVRVQNGGDMSEVDIVTLYDGEIVVNPTFKVKISYLKVRDGGLHVYLKDNGVVSDSAIMSRAALAGENELPLGDCVVTYSTETQYCDVEYTLDATLTPEDRAWSYTTRAEVYGNDGSRNEDTVTFTYQSAHIVFSGEYNESNGNPYVDVLVNPNVDKVILQVVDEDGNKVFVNGSTEEPLTYTRAQLEAMGMTADGTVRIELPFDKYNIEEGTYTATLVAYNADNEVIAMSFTKDKICYNPDNGGTQPGGPGTPGNPSDPNNPDTPEVPDTGLNIFRNLNISSADYILTGVVAFGMVTAFAIFLIVRRNRR